MSQHKNSKDEPTGNEVENCVRAAQLGWGRLQELNLADAMVLDVLRKHNGSMTLDEISEGVDNLAAVKGFPRFDTKQWHWLARLADLSDRQFLSEPAEDTYQLTAQALRLYGDANLHPLRGPRHIADLRVHKVTNTHSTLED
jgi:hypothetical protein